MSNNFLFRIHEEFKIGGEAMIWKTSKSAGAVFTVTGQVGMIEGVTGVTEQSTTNQESAQPLATVNFETNEFRRASLNFELLDFKTTPRKRIKLKDPDPMVKRSFRPEECTRVAIEKATQVSYQVPVPQSYVSNQGMANELFWVIREWGGTVTYLNTDAYSHKYQVWLPVGISWSNLSAFDGSSNGDKVYVPKAANTVHLSKITMGRTIQETRWRTDMIFDYYLYKYNSLRDKLFRITSNLW